MKLPTPEAKINALKQALEAQKQELLKQLLNVQRQLEQLEKRSKT